MILFRITFRYFQIVFEIYKFGILRNNFSANLVSETVKLIEQRELRPGDEIFSDNNSISQNDDDCAIYFIEKGRVQLYSGTSMCLKIMDRGESFGEIGFFTGT